MASRAPCALAICYLSWRWCLYVNVAFAAVSGIGVALLLGRQPSPHRPRLDIPGVLAVSGGMFCIVYGFANAATHDWHTPSTWGFLAAGVALLAVFAWWETRTTVAPTDAGVASASVNTGQQLGGSIGAALLNTIAAAATTSYLANHAATQQALAVVHGYAAAFWWSAAILALGALVAAILFRRGPLTLPRPHP